MKSCNTGCLLKKAQAMLRDPVAFADLLRRLHIPAGLTSRLRRIGVGDTHSVKADRFLDELSEQNSNLADYIRKLFSNEGLNPRQFKFIGFDTDITRGSHLAPRSFVRAMHGTETGDFTGEIPDMVKNPFGAIRSSKRMFAGDAKTLSAYGITSPVTGFLNDKYILRDRRGAPLMIEDTPLSKLVEKGLSKRVADIESRGVASSISSSPASGMRNTNSVGTGRTVRSYLLDRGLASPSRIPEVVRASEGAVDDLTHLRIAFPLNYVDGMSPRWDAGGGMLFINTGSSGGKAFKPHIDPGTLQSTQDVAYDSIMKYIDNAMHKKASSSHQDFDKIVQAYRDRYGVGHGMTPDEAVDNTLHHMPDKYGTRGYAYANVPKIYMDTYGDEVRKAQKAFDSITADRIREISKSASSRRKETWESGEGEVESYTPDKTENHDEIVIRLDDGRRVRISNNTKLGKILKARVGSKVGYHGYRVDGTNVVHRVHPNRRSSGGWLERPRG